MTEIIIFGGTSEGRILAEYCEKRKIPAAVSVATGYGAGLLPESPWLDVHKGPMDREEMEAWIRQKHPRLVMDATHPYAALVTENIRQVCGDNHIPLLRVLRAETPRDEKNGEKAESTVTVETVKEAVDFLAGREGNILVTTGSKELGAFTALEDYRERVYARVLPTSAVLAACEEKGFPGSHIFALQGPFSAEMNVAMLRMASASWLVTDKSSSAISGVTFTSSLAVTEIT